MQFKHPEILYFLALLIIPILVHLFQLQRFVKVPFTNVAFLQKIVAQTRKSSQIKKWLILATRLLALVTVIIAFAQPFFSNKKNNEKVSTLFYIDNSLSLHTKSKRGNSLEVIKQDIAENIAENDSYSLLTNTNFYTNLTASELKDRLKTITTSSADTHLENTLLKIDNQKAHQNTILISDFQNTDNQKIKAVKKECSLVQIIPEERNNISIDSVFIDANTNKNLHIKAIINNQGVAKENIPIAIYNDKQLISKQTFSIGKNSTQQIEFIIQKTPTFLGKLVISTTDAFSFDNTFYFSIDTKDKINVLAIGNNNDFLSKIYTKDEFNFTNVNLKTVNYNSIEKQQLIIINELQSINKSLQISLVKFVKSGGTLLIIPNIAPNINSYNTLFKELSVGKIESVKKDTLKITNINFKHPLLKNVFEKSVNNFQYPTVNSQVINNFNSSSSIIKFENNKDFISQVNLPNIRLFFVAGSLQKSNSNFTNSPLIVPVFYNIGEQSLELSKPYYTINNQQYKIDINTKLSKDNVLQLTHKNESFIPLQQTLQNKVSITTTNQPSYAGFYSVLQQKDTLTTLAFNNNKQESSLNFLDLKTVDNPNILTTNSVKNVIQDINSNNTIHWLWQWFLILAIVSLLLEILILKFYKK